MDEDREELLQRTLQNQTRLLEEIERLTLAWREEQRREAEARVDVEKYKRLWHAAQSTAGGYAGRLAIAEEQLAECRRLLRAALTAAEVVNGVAYIELNAHWFEAARAAGGDE